MGHLGSSNPQTRLVGAVELRNLTLDPAAGEYGRLADQALEHVLPLLDSLPPPLDVPPTAGPH